MVAALFGLLAFVAFVGFGALFLCLLLVKAVFGLVLLPFRLAGAAFKLVFGVLAVAVFVPLVAVGAPLLALAAVIALVVGPVLLIVWGLSRVLRPASTAS